MVMGQQRECIGMLSRIALCQTLLLCTSAHEAISIQQTKQKNDKQTHTSSPLIHGKGRANNK